MATNSDLSAARKAKANEFYTVYSDIECEMNAYLEYNPDAFRGKTVLCPCDDPEWSNFTKFFAAKFEALGLKKLISTSYAPGAANKQISMFEMNADTFDESKHEEHGRIYVLDKDINDSGTVDIEDLHFTYLEGDGDFRSEEVTKLRDEADIIVTNPPFSLFREFLAWIMGGKKKFAIIGNLNAVTYKEVFPLIMDNEIWLGATIHSGDRMFYVPDDYPLEAANCGIDEKGRKFIRVKGVRWYTNIDHGRRHEPLQLMTMRDNLKFNDKLIKTCRKENWVDDNGEPYYPKIDNTNYLEIPYTECIPSDYNDIMAVPISFMDKYDPAQFSIVGAINHGSDGPWDLCKCMINGKEKFKRVAIRKKDQQ